MKSPCRTQDAIFSATNSGRADTLSRPLVGMRKRSEPTSEIELADQQLDQLELKISAAQKIQSIVLTSLKTAFGGSQSNLQLCWRLLAFHGHLLQFSCPRGIFLVRQSIKTPVRLAVLLSEPTVGHGTRKGGSD